MNKFIKSLKKGFTLVELLVVIGIVGVLAAGVAVALDPQDKTRAANDAKAQQAMGTIVGAIKAYQATNNGNYPVAADWAALQTALINNGDIATGGVSLPTGYAFDAEFGLAAGKVNVTQLSKRQIAAGGGATALFCYASGTNATTVVAGPTTNNVTCP